MEAHLRALFLVPLVACREPVTPHEALKADALRADVEVLASDAFGGREALSPGHAAAADWLVAELAKTSLTPLPGEDDLRVPFALTRPVWDLSQVSLMIGDLTFTPPDIAPFAFSASGSARDDAALFVGDGHAAPDLAADDYAGLDATGRIVLALAPATTRPNSSALRALALDAQARGAAAIVVASESDEPKAPELPGDMFLPAVEGYVPVLAVLASRAVGEALVGPRPDVNAALLSGKRPADIAVAPVPVALSAIARPETVGLQGENLFAVLPGTDLADEWVVLGAHYDHVGDRSAEGPGDRIYNGADDNASGSALLLGLARALASRPEPPRRTVVFAWFDAEEAGLIGSLSAFTEHDLPAERIVAMFNFDMVGRNPDRPLQVGVEGFPDRSPLDAAARAQGLRLRYKGDRRSASDEEAFTAQGVPVLWLFTGIHDDYHTPEDEADKLDYPRMERIASMAYDVALALADGTWSGTPAKPK